MPVCLTHQEREATHRCRTCLKPLCGECALTVASGTYCSGSCQEKAEAADQRIDEHLERDRAHRGSGWGPVIQVALLALVVLGAVLAWPYLPPALTGPVDRLLEGLRQR